MNQPDPYQQFPSHDDGGSSAVVRLLIIGAVLVGMTIVGCIGAGVLFARSMGSSHGRNEAPSIYTLRIANRMPGIMLTMLNSLAWRAATDPDVSREVLLEAKIAAEKCVKADEGNAAYLDTLATVFYRLGDDENAIIAEMNSLRAERRPFAVSQLARFEVRFTAKRKGPATTGPAMDRTPTMRIGPVDPTTGIPSLLLELAETPPGGVLVHAAVVHDATLFAHVTVWVPPNYPVTNGEITLAPEDGCGHVMAQPDGIELRTVMVDTRPLAENRQWTTPKYCFVAMDPEVASLP